MNRAPTLTRRAFLAILAFATPIVASGARRHDAPARRIGLLGVDAFGDEQRESIRSHLAERGWVEGRNLIVETRYADGDPARLPALADASPSPCRLRCCFAPTK